MDGRNWLQFRGSRRNGVYSLQLHNRKALTNPCQYENLDVKELKYRLYLMLLQ
jgi:hypothetical protein